jgi:hypothetical protein
MKSLQNLWLTQPICSWLWYSTTPLIFQDKDEWMLRYNWPCECGHNSWSHMWQNAMKKLPNFLRDAYMWRGAETSIGWYIIACWIRFCKALVNNKLIRDGASMVVRPLHTHHSNGELSTASTCRVDSAHMAQDIDSYTWMELGQYDGSGH